MYLNVLHSNDAWWDADLGWLPFKTQDQPGYNAPLQPGM